MMKPLLAFLLIPVSTFGIPCLAQARINTLTGGITTSFDYNETNNDTDNTVVSSSSEDRSLKQISIGPIIIFVSESTIDELRFSYRPSATYDFEGSSSDMDHDFSLSAFRYINKKLRFDVSDALIYSNDPDLLTTETTSDYNEGRKRYLTNAFSINSTYNYDTGSSFSGGYTYSILRNEDTGIDGYEDYDRHIFNVSLQHRINAFWNVGMTSSYTRGLFSAPDQETINSTTANPESISPGAPNNQDSANISSDLSEYNAGISVNWLLSKRKKLLGSYDYSTTIYDSTLQNNSSMHNLTAGAEYLYNPRLSFSLGGGPSYAKTETFAGTFGYNAHFNVNYDIARHSKLTASVIKSYSQENFSSNNNTFSSNQGLTDFWEWKLDFSHQLLKDLSLNLFASYHDEQQEQSLAVARTNMENETVLQAIDREAIRDNNTIDKTIYETGGSLSYSFLRWWTAAVNYTYRKQESDQINDSYDEHRLYLTMTVQKELLRW